MLKNIQLLCISLFVFSSHVFAAGETSYPADWKTWKSVSTPLSNIGALPGCDADVSNLPPIYQETVELYLEYVPKGQVQ